MGTGIATIALVAWALLGVAVVRWGQTVLGSDQSIYDDIATPEGIASLRQRLLRPAPQPTRRRELGQAS